jgi:serine/threonine-protein kinase
MGVVYRATQLALGRPVALKAIAPDLTQDTEFRERFQTEAQIAASIDHPNVIPVYEAGELDGVLYLIMRWVDGTDLRVLLTQHGRLTPARALTLLRPVALALAAAHGRGLVHRDVKPANVLIAQARGQEDHVYLTDFGIARRLDARGITRTGMLVGTLDYTSPERLEGAPGTFADDVYSFGCMLFETLTGHVPFNLSTDAAKIYAHINDPVPSARAEVGGVTEQLDAIIARAMAKRPEDRFLSGQLAAALDYALAEVETDALAVGTRRLVSDRTRVSGMPRLAPATPDRGARAGLEAPPAPSGRRDVPVAGPTGRRRRSSPSGARTAVQRARPSSSGRAPRRALLAGGIVAALVVIGVLVALLAGGGGKTTTHGTGATATSGGAEATVVSGTGLAPEQTIALPAVAGAISVAPAGDVWATLPSAGKVARVRPAGGGVATFAVAGSMTAIAAGRRGVWVGSASGSLTRLDLATGAQQATGRLSAGIVALAVDPNDGSAWAADGNGSVAHTGVNGGPLGVGTRVTPQPVDIGWGEGWVWAVNAAPDGLLRISLQGGPSATALNARPGALAVTFDAGVWTASSDGTVTRFDPRPGHLTANASVAVAPALDGIAALEQQGSIWAIGKQAKRLYRISNANAPAVTGSVAFSSPPVALAVGRSAVWVATQDGKLVEFHAAAGA